MRIGLLLESHNKGSEISGVSLVTKRTRKVAVLSRVGTYGYMVKSEMVLLEGCEYQQLDFPSVLTAFPLCWRSHLAPSL